MRCRDQRGTFSEWTLPLAPSTHVLPHHGIINYCLCFTATQSSAVGFCIELGDLFWSEIFFLLVFAYTSQTLFRCQIWKFVGSLEILLPIMKDQYSTQYNQHSFVLYFGFVFFCWATSITSLLIKFTLLYKTCQVIFSVHIYVYVIKSETGSRVSHGQAAPVCHYLFTVVRFSEFSCAPHRLTLIHATAGAFDQIIVPLLS